jgi:hypothetical protein
MAILERIRSRYAPLLLIAAGVGAALVVVPGVPHERRVDLRLEDAVTVTGVELAWTPVPSAEDPGARAPVVTGVSEPVHGVSWRFPAGKAPATVDARVSLPDGRYALDVVVERGADHESFHRVIALGDADHITVPLHGEPR